jgi:hypothetical protein
MLAAEEETRGNWLERSKKPESMESTKKRQGRHSGEISLPIRAHYGLTIGVSPPSTEKVPISRPKVRL